MKKRPTLAEADLMVQLEREREQYAAEFGRRLQVEARLIAIGGCLAAADGFLHAGDEMLAKVALQLGRDGFKAWKKAEEPK